MQEQVIQAKIRLGVGPARAGKVRMLLHPPSMPSAWHVSAMTAPEAARAWLELQEAPWP